MADRLDWEDARRRDIVTRNGGIPAWSDMASDVVRDGRADTPSDTSLTGRAERRVRGLLRGYLALDVPTRKERYWAARRHIDLAYRQARQRAHQMTKSEQRLLRDALDRRQFRAHGQLLRLSGLTAEQAKRGPGSARS